MLLEYIMKKFLLTILLLVQMLCVTCAYASPAIPPKPAGADMYVQDYAEVIAPIDKGRILDIGLELQDKTSAQVVVLTVKDLEQEPIEAYAEDVMQNWELGSRESHAGVLMVVATDNKQAYIEVGSGLEGVLPQRLVNTIQKEKTKQFYTLKNDIIFKNVFVHKSKSFTPITIVLLSSKFSIFISSISSKISLSIS